MPYTRSMRSLSTLPGNSKPSAAATPSRSPGNSKRKTQDTDATDTSSPSQTSKKPRVFPTSTSASVDSAFSFAGATPFLPAVLSFSVDVAKQHLIDADSRFKGIFEKLPCRPFEHLERVDPFRGQQISWLAARAITHRFIRLYDPSLPEKPLPLGFNREKSPQQLFPTASQVANTDIATLKSAGLSTRKAEYVQDLASRFADGRLTKEKLVDADDEELARLLIEVRGIGKWTVDMFAMFSLRRPDILPVGDLGVQRGLIRWFLSLHSPSNPIAISPKKLPKAPGNVLDDQDPSAPGDPSSTGNEESIGAVLPSANLAPAELDVSALPPVPVTPTKGKGEVRSARNGETPSASPGKTGLDIGGMPLIPEPFTPSINKTLQSSAGSGVNIDALNGTGAGTKSLAPLPDGMTIMSLKNRLSGKKIKGMLLTPQEMYELTAPWRPYRSLGVYYMWALDEETA